MDKLKYKFVWQRILIILTALITIAPSLAQTCNSTITTTAPDSRYQDHGDGTVTDLQTGLMWQQCSLGQSGVGCETGSAIGFTWDSALQAVENHNSNGGFAGYIDWRLPNRKELESLIEVGCYSPAINTSIFPNTLSRYYWSSSPYAGSSSRAWGVYFSYGGSNDYLRANYGFLVRLVRSGQ